MKIKIYLQKYLLILLKCKKIGALRFRWLENYLSLVVSDFQVWQKIVLTDPDSKAKLWKPVII